MSFDRICLLTLLIFLERKEGGVEESTGQRNLFGAFHFRDVYISATGEIDSRSRV
jgi:hypothetical protein